MVRRLFYKELQLQRSNYYLALGAILLWVLLYIGASWAARPLSSMVNVGTVIQGFYYFLLLPILWILLPLTIGASVVAGERALGVFDWTFAFPISRGWQWAVKGCTAVLLSFLLASLLPFLLETLLMRKLAGLRIDWTFSNQHLLAQCFKVRSLWPGIYAIPLVAAGAFASTFSRDSFRALLWGVLIVALLFYFQSFADPDRMLFPMKVGYPSQYLRPYVHYLHLLVLTAGVLMIGRANFQFEKPRNLQLAMQAIVFGLLVLILTRFALYGEFWAPSLKPFAGAPISTTSRNPEGLTEPEPLIAPYQITLGELFRIPNSNRILLSYGGRAESYRLGELEKGYGNPRGHLLEIDVVTGRQRQYPYVYGEILGVDPDGGRFLLQAAPYGRLLEVLRAWPLAYNPLKSPASWFTTPNSFGSVQLSKYTSTSWNRLRALIHQKFRQDLNDVPNYNLFVCSGDFFNLAILRPDRTSWDRYLIRVERNGESFEILDGRKADASSSDAFYCVSPDGKWYASRAGSIDPIVVQRVDHSTSATLHPEGQYLRVAPLDSFTGRSFFESERPNRINTPFTLRVSPDGRYLAYIRVAPAGSVQNPPPKKVLLMVLDLEDGSDHVLAAIECGSNYDPNFRQLHAAWSSKGDLAFIHDQQAYLFVSRRWPQDPTRWIARAFNVPLARDLTFLSDNLLILWGDTAMWKIDLDTAAWHAFDRALSK